MEDVGRNGEVWKKDAVRNGIVWKMLEEMEECGGCWKK